MRHAPAVVLGVSVSFMTLGLGIIAPALPLFGRVFGVGAALVGLLITVFGVGRVLLDIPAGYLADRMGRRAVLLGSSVIVAGGSVLAASAGTFGNLLIWRFVQGAGSAIFTTAAMTAIVDLTGPAHRGRAMSLYAAALLIGASLGPGIGGIVTSRWGPRAPFLAYAVLALLVFVWVFLQVPETTVGSPQISKVAPAAPDPPYPWKDFILVALVTFATFVARVGGRSTILPLFAYNRLGMSVLQVGLVLSMIAVLNLLVLYPLGTLTDRFGRKVAIVPGVLLIGLAFAQLAFAPSYAALLLGAVLLGIGDGIGGPVPAAYMADLSPSGRTGLAIGLYRLFGDLGFLVGPITLGWISDTSGYAAALLANAGLMVAAAIPFALFAREHLGEIKETVPALTTGSER